MQSGLEAGAPLAQPEDEKPEPKRGDAQQCPLVQGESAQPLLPTAVGQCRALSLASRELEVGANVGVAGGQSFGLEVSSQGPAVLAGFEKGIAEIEIN